MKIIRYFIFGLLLLFWVLLFLDFCFINGFFEDYIKGAATETFGIIITIILIEIILSRHRKKEETQKAKKRLQRAVKVLDVYIENYRYAAFNLSYKYTQYKEQRKKGLIRNFPFSNFSEIFLTNPDIIDSYGKTKAEAYFERMDDLKNTIKSTLFQIDLSHFPELSDLLQNYLVEVEKFYPKNGIIEDKNNPQVRELMEGMLKEHTGEVKYRNSNMLNKYVRLYELVNFHIDFIEEYNEHIKKLLNGKK